MDLLEDYGLFIIVFVLLVFLILILAFAAVNAKGKPAGPRERFCPLCGRKLDPGETVLGIIMSTKPPQKIMIRGCRACATRESRDDDPNEWS